MIHILAVMSQYEIELFTARGIDGKISSMKNRGAYNGGPCPYGYTISPGTGKLVVNPEEAEVVRTIFEKFSKGEKTAAITDWLNASGIPCSFRTRIAAANQRRINKGFSIISSTSRIRPILSRHERERTGFCSQNSTSRLPIHGLSTMNCSGST